MSTTVLLWVQDPEYSQKIVKFDDYEYQTIVIKGSDIFSSLQKFSEHHDGTMCEIIVPEVEKDLSKLLELCFSLFGTNFTLRL